MNISNTNLGELWDSSIYVCKAKRVGGCLMASCLSAGCGDGGGGGRGEIPV